MIGHQSIDNLRPNDVVRPSLLAQYTEKMGIFSDDLTIAHTNLGILRQMREFDAELFGAPTAFMTLLHINLTDQILLILTRLWKDERSIVRLDKFSDWLKNTATRPEHREAVATAIAQAWPSPEVCEAIERCRKIRHARIAHQSGRLPLRTALVLVSQEEVEFAAKVLGQLYNAMNFGTSEDLVFIEFQAREGQWADGDFGYVLDRIALGSTWLSLPFEHLDLWRRLRERLNEDQVAAINKVRKRHNLPPLP